MKYYKLNNSALNIIIEHDPDTGVYYEIYPEGDRSGPWGDWNYINRPDIWTPITKAEAFIELL